MKICKFQPFVTLFEMKRNETRTRNGEWEWESKRFGKSLPFPLQLRYRTIAPKKSKLKRLVIGGTKRIVFKWWWKSYLFLWKDMHSAYHDFHSTNTNALTNKRTNRHTWKITHKHTHAQCSHTYHREPAILYRNSDYESNYSFIRCWINFSDPIEQEVHSTRNLAISLTNCSPSRLTSTSLLWNFFRRSEMNRVNKRSKIDKRQIHSG